MSALTLEGIIAQALGTGVGFGMGLALGTALEAEAVGLQQDSFNENPLKAIDPATAARIVAQGLQEAAWGESEAASGGIDSTRFANMVAAELRGPAVGEVLQFIRREIGGDADVAKALRKLQLDPAWDSFLTQLAVVPLDPAEIAKAIHRGIIAAEGLLVAVPPTTPGSVPIVPPSSIDAITEAGWSGISAERLRVMVGNAGLPPGPQEMLQLWNRGLITEDDFLRGVGESNMRNEWGRVLAGLRRRLLTPREYAEAELRGVKVRADAQAGAGLTGLEADDYVTLFETVGRPLNVHAITTGLARGGTFGGTYSDVPEPYQDAIRRSAIRPEYAVLAYANRYTYPTPFVIRAMAQAGELGDTAAVEQVLLEIGWKPAFAANVAKAWAPAGTAADKHVAKAQTQLWTAAHKAYVDDRMTDTQAQAELVAAGVEAVAVAAVLSLWQRERAIFRAGLSAADVRKAVGQPGHDEAWALERLAELGYSSDDATTYLAE